MYTVTLENNISGIERAIEFNSKQELNKFLEGNAAIDAYGEECKRDDEKERVSKTEKNF